MSQTHLISHQDNNIDTTLEHQVKPPWQARWISMGDLDKILKMAIKVLPANEA
jgi:hypothetical protein